MQSGVFGETPGEIAALGFWGWQSEGVPPMPDWVVPVVMEALERPDPTDGALYVFSRHDLTVNWWTWDTATAHAGSGSYALYTFREIPPQFPKSPVLTK